MYSYFNPFNKRKDLAQMGLLYIHVLLESSQALLVTINVVIVQLERLVLLAGIYVTLALWVNIVLDAVLDAVLVPTVILVITSQTPVGLIVWQHHQVQTLTKTNIVVQNKKIIFLYPFQASILQPIKLAYLLYALLDRTPATTKRSVPQSQQVFPNS